MRSSSRRGTLAIVPVVLSLLLASCGGNSDEAGNSSVASAPSGATSTTPGSGGTGTRGDSRSQRQSRHAPRKSSGTGGAAPTKASKKAKRRIKRKQRQLEKKIQKIEKKAKEKGNTGAPTPTTTTPASPPPRSGTPQAVLFNKAKRVCNTLTLNGLAQRYDVDATPQAVSTAYAASYPKTFRKAVHDGCLAAFTG